MSMVERQAGKITTKILFAIIFLASLLPTNKKHSNILTYPKPVLTLLHIVTFCKRNFSAFLLTHI
jgi:hypothetical protein